MLGRRPSILVDKLLISGVCLAILGLVQFLIFVNLAMDHYPGGMIADADSTGYSWTGNWLSDLGRLEAINGVDNETSSRYFNGSIIGLGMSLLAFFAVSIRAFEEQSIVSAATTFAGLSASLGLI